MIGVARSGIWIAMLCPPRSRYPLKKDPVASNPPRRRAGSDLFSGQSGDPRQLLQLTISFREQSRRAIIDRGAPHWELPDQPKGSIMFKRTIAIAFVSVSLLAVAACNTVEGAGKDVSSAGKAVANAASDAK